MSSPLTSSSSRRGILSCVSQLGRGDAGRHADDPESVLLDALAQPLDHERSRRAGTQPDDHPRLDQVRRGPRRSNLRGIQFLTHRACPASLSSYPLLGRRPPR